LETILHDSDDPIGLPVQRERFANYLRIASKVLRP
jgi:hypothetical protein